MDRLNSKENIDPNYIVYLEGKKQEQSLLLK